MKFSVKEIGCTAVMVLAATLISQCVGILYKASLKDDVKEVTKVDNRFDAKLRIMVKEMNKILPTDFNGTNRTDSVAILPNKELRFYCTIFDKNWNSTEAEQKKFLLENAKYLNFDAFKKEYVTISYAYYRNGNCFMIFKLLPEEY